MERTGFASLFNISEEDLLKKTKGKDDKASKKKEKKTESKSPRYSLPVRIRCGYIQMDFSTEEYGGKTLDERTIKIKLREQYPELSGLSFTIKDLSPTIAIIEKESIIQLESKEVETDLEIKTTAEVAIQDTAVSAKGLNMVINVDTGNVEDSSHGEVIGVAEESDETEASMEVPDFAEADVRETGVIVSDNTNVYTEREGGGSWLTLQIYYQEIGEKQILTFPVTLINGAYQISIEKNMGIEAIRQLWIDSYPEYKGCKLYYDDRRNLLVPYMEPKREQELSTKEFKLPITVGYLHLTRVYTATDFGDEQEEATLEEIRQLYGQIYPEFRYSTYYYNEEDHILFPVITKDEKIDGSEKLTVPVTVRVIGTEVILQDTDFKGKRTATLEEVRQVVENIYPEYAKERTEMLVDARGFVVPVLRGSRKGYLMIPGKNGRSLNEVTGRDGNQYRVEKSPFGIYESRTDGANPNFYLTAPKIPTTVIRQVVEFFMRTPTKEAAVQIFYIPESQTYEIYIPKQVCTGSSVVFERCPEKESYDVLVMDVHSHGAYPAFFSMVDDQDEKGTRLFMVVGNLNTNRHSFALRAGIAGSYQMLELGSVFEGGI